jgi:threonine/homoserine/homoserine lactone efflux protein
LFLRGLLSNIFNPKSVLFFASVLPTFVRNGPGTPSLPTQMAVFGALYVGVATAVHGSIVVLAAQLRPWLLEGPLQQTVRRILAVLLALVAVWLAWATRR